MKILITGICGFVGSTLAEELRSEPWVTSIIGIDNFCRPGSELNRSPLVSSGIQIFSGDIRIQSDVDNLPKVDFVIDAAANPSVLAGVDGKTSSRQLIEHNLGGTVNLLEYCKRYQSGLILLSTSRVYSIQGLVTLRYRVEQDALTPEPSQIFPAGISPFGIDESYTTSPPVSLYGSTKVTSEHLSLEYGDTFDFPVWINRCGVMAGARQFGHPAQGIFAFWLHSYFQKKPMKYIGFKGSGNQVRDCLHPRDLVPLIEKQVEASQSAIMPHDRILNVAGGSTSAISLTQLSAWCADRWSRHVVDRDLTPRAYDLPWVVLDSTKAQLKWDWTPKTSLPAILEEIADFAERNPKWLDISNY